MMDGGKENFITKQAYFLPAMWRRLDDQIFHTKRKKYSKFLVFAV